jgi:SAM-dependent methyltransferase
MSEWHEANRLSWNAATKQHNSHKGDQAAFLREGGSTLFPEEIELLGDVRGMTLVHLQCNAGQDTLSIAGRLGAVVTGVDISDEAITFAQKLSTDAAIPGTFIRSDIYDWFAARTEEYDLVFVSYGALCWLSDIKGWGRGVAAALKPGGRLVVIEFHPILNVLWGVFYNDWSEAYDYMGGRCNVADGGVGDYVGDSGGGLIPSGEKIESGSQFENPHGCYEFSWGVAEIITALLDAGLRITILREYPYSNGFKPFPDMVELPGRRMTMGDGLPNMPLMYGLCAVK